MRLSAGGRFVPIPKACVFCGGVPLSPEHLMGNWMNRNPATAMPGPQTHFIGAIPGLMETRVSDQYDQTAECVCGACNHGWMSNMEKVVAPFLTTVSTETVPQFPERSHLVVALWAVTRAMVKQYQGDIPETLIAAEQSVHVRRFLEPPPVTFVFRMSRRLVIPMEGNEPVAVDGVVLAKVIAALDVNATVTPVTFGWQARVSKGAVHIGIVSFSALPDAPIELARMLLQGGEPLVQIWPPNTDERQIRVRHPRGSGPEISETLKETWSRDVIQRSEPVANQRAVRAARTRSHTESGAFPCSIGRASG
jgi:hypothetical protein